MKTTNGIHLDDGTIGLLAFLVISAILWNLIGMWIWVIPGAIFGLCLVVEMGDIQKEINSRGDKG